MLVILFVLFDLIYLSYSAGDGEISLLFYIIMTAVILIYGIIIARLKVKQTNRTGFIPALFVMVVITALELSLALRAVDVDYIILMLTPLLAANSYQVLALHEVTKRDEEHIKRIEERRKARQLKKNKPAEKTQ